jgi:eukaryotic-like serine/threonine-protein kinase
MSSQIVLKVVEGEPRGKEFSFQDHTQCTVGRSSSCLLHLPDDEDRTISRRHCLLDIDPPQIQLTDLGSLNGTYVNGQWLGGRKLTPAKDSSGVAVATPYPLKDGDEVRVGQTVLRVEVIEDASNTWQQGQATSHATN